MYRDVQVIYNESIWEATVDIPADENEVIPSISSSSLIFGDESDHFFMNENTTGIWACAQEAQHTCQTWLRKSHRDGIVNLYLPLVASSDLMWNMLIRDLPFMMRPVLSFDKRYCPDGLIEVIDEKQQFVTCSNNLQSVVFSPTNDIPVVLNPLTNSTTSNVDTIQPQPKNSLPVLELKTTPTEDGCRALGRWNPDSNSCDLKQCAPGFEPTVQGLFCVPKNTSDKGDYSWVSGLSSFITHTDVQSKFASVNGSSLDPVVFAYLSQTVLSSLPKVVIDSWKSKGLLPNTVNVNVKSDVPLDAPIMLPVTTPNLPLLPLSYKGEFDRKVEYKKNDVVLVDNDLAYVSQNNQNIGNQPQPIMKNWWLPATPNELNTISILKLKASLNPITIESINTPIQKPIEPSIDNAPPLLSHLIGGNKSVRRWVNGQTCRYIFLTRHTHTKFFQVQMSTNRNKQTRHRYILSLNHKAPGSIYIWVPHQRRTWKGRVNSYGDVEIKIKRFNDIIVHRLLNSSSILKFIK